MRLLFFGSGEFGLPTLQHLHTQHELLAVVSQPDRPAGRKRKLQPTPVSDWALKQGLPLIREEDINTPEAVATINAYNADASVVIAFGQKLSPELVDAMGALAINLHASLLPLYRGAAPINRAMMDNHTVTGVAVIGIAQRMDAGPVYAEASLSIDPRETAGELHDRLAALGPDAITRVLNDLQNNTLKPVTQDESKATRAAKLRKDDGTIDFNTDAPAARARIHGLTPWPGCRVHWLDENNTDLGPLLIRRVADHRDSKPNASPGTVLADGYVACQSGTIQLLELQAPGGRPMPYQTFIRGHNLAPGHQLKPWA